VPSESALLTEQPISDVKHIPNPLLLTIREWRFVKLSAAAAAIRVGCGTTVTLCNQAFPYRASVTI
jgi:hypothetical protein